MLPGTGTGGTGTTVVLHRHARIYIQHVYLYHCSFHLLTCNSYSTVVRCTTCVDEGTHALPIFTFLVKCEIIENHRNNQ